VTVEERSRRLAVASDVTRCAEVRQFVRDSLTEAGAGASDVADVVQAVDELVTNVIEHGYGNGPGDIEVTVDSGSGRATIRIVDHAPAYDPTAHAEPLLDLPLERRPLGGMGIHLARTLTDEMRHRILPTGGNEVTLVKTWGPPQEGGG
jgi:anti-sigma regulatory factor (Ser/Thr protein kinase)